jgi:Holliday junction resolvase
MPGHPPTPPPDNEGQIRLLVEGLLRNNGWNVLEEPREQNVRPDLIAERRGTRLAIEIKRASEGRRDRVIPLLSQAALEAAHYARNLGGHPVLPVAIVGANHIPDSVAEEAKQFVRERAPDMAVGLVDLEGLQSFAGLGLESLNSERRKESGVSSPKLRSHAPQLFSDLNQWMLKVLLAPGISEDHLSAPRGHYQGASQLAEAASVSVMSAFRFVEQFSKEGFLEQRSRRLRIVRSNELMKRWQAASQQRVLEIPMRWILNKGKKALPNALRSFTSAEVIPLDGKRKQNRVLLSPRPRACLGLFAAAEALGLGFVHGVQPYLYLERMSQDIVESLGLSAKGADQQADIYVRIPGNRESVFRGAVVKGGVPSSDILQVWLDVSQHPSRGKEQADLIWRRVLAPAFEAFEANE